MEESSTSQQETASATGSAGGGSSTAVAIVVIILLVIGGVWLLRSKAPGGAVISGPVKIGYIGPLTGEAASVGEPGVGGAELAVKEINDAGGVLGQKLELVIEDDQCSNKGVAAITKLVNIDKVAAITGPDCSASAGPALPVAQQAGVPVVVRWASAPHLTKIGDYIFRVYPSDAFQGQYAAEFLFNQLSKKKVAVVYVKNDWGEGIDSVFVEKFKALGGEVVLEEGVTQDNKDFRGIIAKIKAKNPEAIYMPLYPGGGVPAIKQIKEAGLKVTMVGGDAYDTDEVIKSDSGEGVIYTVAKINNSEEFQQRVTAATGKKADKITAPMAYDAVKIIAAAITKAGRIDGKSIRDALAQTSYQGVSSPVIEFDANGDLKVAVFEVKVIKGKKSETYK